jgi:hypothetical protein
MTRAAGLLIVLIIGGELMLQAQRTVALSPAQWQEDVRAL